MLAPSLTPKPLVGPFPRGLHAGVEASGHRLLGGSLNKTITVLTLLLALLTSTHRGFKGFGLRIQQPKPQVGLETYNFRV